MKATAQEKVDFYNLTKEELTEILKEKFGATKYRATQLFEWVYRKHVSDFDKMTNINKELREKLAEYFVFPKADVKKKSVSKDGSA